MVHFPENPDDGPFFASSPEELKDYMRQQQEHAQQLSTDVRHQIETFLEKLEEDDLDTMRFLLHMATNQGPSFTLVFEGYITGLLKNKYGICPACHKNHDNELAKITGEQNQPTTEVSFEGDVLRQALDKRTVTGTEPAESLEERLTEIVADRVAENEQIELDFTTPVPPTTREAYEARKDENIETPHGGYMRRSAAMELYRLEPYDDMYFYCRDCGITYVSLEDRMLKRPDECHGCMLKASQG